MNPVTNQIAAPTRVISLPSGQLAVSVARSEFPLDQLCGFASRRSTRRGFVFVSKVLGKHWPVRPSVFEDCCQRLAARLPAFPSPVVVIGMAETATGLGQGVFEAMLDLQLSAERTLPNSEALFIQGTRYRLGDHAVLGFEESHSHATDHLIHQPADEHHRRILKDAKTLVVVDDEQSTGRTTSNLARAIRMWCPQLERLIIVCLTDFLSEVHRREIGEQVKLEVDFVSLLTGSFEFTPASDFTPPETSSAIGRSHCRQQILPTNFGRLGLAERLSLNEAELTEQARLQPGQRILVLGTGEFHYPAFRWALHLERQGHNVVFHSTTRSPLLLSGALTSVTQFYDNYSDGIPNYVYNVADRHYDQILIVHETNPWPAECEADRLLNARRFLMCRTD